MLTQDLLRDNWPAMSATLIAFRFRSSSMNRACSRMVRDRSLETRSRLMIAAASSSPSDAYGAIRMRSFDAHRYRLNPFSKMLTPAASTPSKASSMPRSAIEASRRASTAGFLIR
jgi:hypothetical protein